MALLGTEQQAHTTLAFFANFEAPHCVDKLETHIAMNKEMLKIVLNCLLRDLNQIQPSGGRFTLTPMSLDYLDNMLT